MSEFKCAIFYKDRFQEERTFKELPLCGDYIHFQFAKHLAWRVERRIFLDSNYEKWDVVLVIGGTVPSHPSASAFNATVAERATKRREEAQSRRLDLRRFNEPEGGWQQRKTIWERHEAGESFEKIAEELGKTVDRVKALNSEWRRLIQRVKQHEEADTNA